MTKDFRVAIERFRGKRIPLEYVRRCWNEAHPEQTNNPRTAASMLEDLDALRRDGVIEFPKQASSFDHLVNPPLPKFVLLVCQEEKPLQEDWSRVSWQPELAFWTNLKPQELAWAKKINEWLCRRRGKFMQVPLRERSLEIFGNEKFLDARVRDERLFSGRLPLSAIGAFLVAPPLAYRASGMPDRPLLIVENHHTYWSLAEWNIQTRRYSAVAYGVGNAVTSKSNSKSNAVAQVVRECHASTVLYFGDLDPEGIEIPLRLFAEDNALQGAPDVDLYRFILEHGTRRLFDEGKKKTYDRNMVTEWLPSMCDEICSLWDAGLWVPQESLGSEQLFAGDGSPREHPNALA